MTIETLQIDRAHRLERAMIRVRWFGIVFGLFQLTTYEPNPGTILPNSATTIGYAALGALLVTNIAAMVLLRIRPRSVRALGLCVFAADVAVLWTMSWAYNAERFGQTWVLFLILPLEGALRWNLRGALVPVLATFPFELVRQLYLSETFGWPFNISIVTWRIGMMFIVGSVAGVMARNLGRERAQAVDRSRLLEELAEREGAARRESAAFQAVILAGVASPDLQTALGSMVERITSALGYERVAVLLRDDETLRAVVAHGFQTDVLGGSVTLGEGIAGAVAVSARSEIVPDVSQDPRYYMVDPTTRSQISVPISTRDRVLGVLDVESARLDAFGEEDRSRLERLSAQMALVIEQARLLAQEREGLERLRQLDAMKSDFIAIASHELRTPLTAMKGSIKTLRRHDGRLTARDTDELLSMLDRQSERLARLVDDLLVASNLDAGGLALRMNPTRVPDVIEVVLEELGPRASRVSVAYPPYLPSVMTDAQRLGQIARNLIENALKFAPEETLVRVTVHHEPGALLVEVTDEGPGIPAEEIPNLFERFHQIGDSLRRHNEGFGLGLYITKRLVEALRGTIEIESQVGRGSTFRVWLPDAGAAGASEEIA